MTIIHLPQRQTFTVTGADAAKFLQGQITNDIKKVEAGKALYAAHLTSQGKFLHDLFILPWPDGYLLDTENAAALIEIFKKFKLRAKITLSPSDLMVYALLDEALLPAVGQVVPDPRLPALGRRLYAPAGLATSGTLADYDARRLPLGVGDGQRDLIPDKAILLEHGFGELQGVDFNKGCYIGQELTARTHFRKLIKKRLLPVTFTGAAPAFDTPILLGGEVEAGAMRSAGAGIGLALLRLEVLASSQKFNAPLQAGQTLLYPSVPDWVVLPQP